MASVKTLFYVLCGGVCLFLLTDIISMRNRKNQYHQANTNDLDLALRQVQALQQQLQQEAQFEAERQQQQQQQQVYEVERAQQARQQQQFRQQQFQQVQRVQQRPAQMPQQRPQQRPQQQPQRVTTIQQPRPVQPQQQAMSTDSTNDMSLHTGERKQSHYPPKVHGKPKGFANKDLLFELKDACDPSMDYQPPAMLCLGVGPSRHPRKTCPENQIEKGTFDALPRVGGPTGCQQAWVTVQGDDSFLAATLVLIHTVRKYSREDRDFVVIASTAVSQPVLDQLLSECVRVIQVDPFDGNELAKQLVSKSERYRSGYWLLKMYVWRLMEYSKLVYLDGDIYFRHNPDPLFCVPTPPKKAPIGVTPRSSFNPSAGFNAGMFVYNPSRDIFQGILKKFLGLSETDMLATSEQDFLNEFFKGRYNLIPIDFVCKHRRMINEGPKKWDLMRVHSYHMNGNPKPWNPTWRTACAYPDEHAAKANKYVEFFKEWWAYYYDFIDQTVPYNVADYHLLPEHDLYKVRWATWDPKAYKCPAALKGISNKGR